MPIRRHLIKQHVEDLLVKSEVASAPVPIEKIADTLGLEVRYEPLDGDLSGCLVRQEGSKPTVGINSQQSSNRQRFTLAHECAHFLLHKGEEVILDRTFHVNRRDTVSQKAEEPDEIEANFFAAELLMPEKFLKEDLTGKAFDLLDDDLIEELAKKYMVSQQAFTYRLVNLGYLEPVLERA
ncbi:MAG: ImmA/IrrE family metallo-endopeptidase [Elusimicrobia bacterium]|nr:ImmA/IrrE family metallo-endopeptidase [Elusimicrobiota bacterium]MDE2425931.1 ImmA/IrrE family metallo-endopeptidase [Elusimicrobiota bacterium]